MSAPGKSPRKPPWPAPSLISEFSTPAMRNVLATTAPLPASGAASCPRGRPKKLGGSSSALRVFAVSFGAARNSIVLPIASAGF